jgi:HAMP domain-containing protein/signal transduction histidine kinase
VPKADPRRRKPVELSRGQTSSPGPNGSADAPPKGPDRRLTQSISPADAELILTVLREVRKGNFSVRMPVAPNGVMAKIAAEMNDLIELNERNAKNLSGVARVIGAVAEGDLFQTMDLELDGRPLEGQFLRTAKTVNSMVHQLRSFTSEVTRVAGEVGTEGRLGGQAHVRGAAGVWKDLTDNVNLMAANLTAQVRNIANVTTAVANGDLSKKITVDVRGEILELKDTINTMVDQLNAFSSEVTRVAREVGTEGKLGGQAQVRGIGGVWKDLTDNVNFMAGNLTAQVRNIAEVTTAVQKGDLSKKITVEVQGEILELKNTINVMVDQLNAFAREVTRVAREVGTEGKLGGQAEVQGVAGVWKDLTDNVNYMAGNLTAQVRNIAEVTTAVAEGDLSKKITVDVRGEILQLKNTINSMVDQLNAFAGEVTRVAREVGTEGKLGGQASVPGASGTWKDLTQQVNQLAANLTTQVRNIAEVTTAVQRGDLSKKITVEVQGEILELKNTINVMVDQLNAFAGEVSRVAREVGTEGRLGGQAHVPGASGTWKDLTDNVNSMAGNLTAQVRNIAEVTTAVARGDLSKKITVDVHGEIRELKETINVMVDQLNAFASEVTRVAREVGTEGKLGGQAQVKGVVGIWKDLTDNVNFMAGNLTAHVRNIAEVTTAVAMGDLSKKITVDVRGEILDLKNTINVMVDQLNAFVSEVTRVAREVGTEGRLGGQAYVLGASGTWRDLTDNVNQLAANLTTQVRNIAEVTTAVQRGDLSKKITVEVRGEILELKDTINVMVDQLNAFASEVTRVAREVGTEGKLGGQAQVKGVAGTWKDLTDSVNLMAGNLTDQVRGIARVVTAVANGDLRRKVVFEAKGEIAALADTINEMTDTLAIFAEQVTTVARKVGVEGELGGQASVPGAAGTWKDLTDNVNQLTATLTTQVRAIAEVTTAVTEGDLTRSIGVKAKGEVALLADKINEMIRNLKETTQKNMEQDWLKTNIAKHTQMLQGQRNLRTVADLILTEVAPLVFAHYGAFYIVETREGDEPALRMAAGYAVAPGDNPHQVFRWGEGLVGQCARDGRRIVLTTVPAGYVTVRSGLGEAPPANIVVLPVLFEGGVKAVIELASMQPFSPSHLDFLDQLTDGVGVVLNTIEANMRTEELLKQSQILFAEAQEASKSKSAFLSMAAHELRTPLSVITGYLSMLQDGTITPDNAERPLRVLIGKATELNSIVDDLLTAARIEGGTVPTDTKVLDLREMARQAVSRAEPRAGLLKADVLYDEPDEPVYVNADREQLARIIDNLINNALTYTAGHPWVSLSVSLEGGPSLIIEDHGVGIPKDKQEKIFERFFRIDDPGLGPQPGTGLGLFISRELSERHGGSLTLERSEVGKGSTFVLRLPPVAAPRAVDLLASPPASLESIPAS